MKYKPIISILALMILALGIQTPAYSFAVLTLNDPDTEVSVTVADGDGDGFIVYNDTVGPRWSVNVTTGLTKPLLGSAEIPQMDLNSVNVSSNSGGGTLIVSFTDVEFGPMPAGWYFKGEYGGVSDGSVNYGAYLNGTPLFASGPAGPGAFSGTIAGGNGPYAFPYSLTQELTITHTGAGQITSGDFELKVAAVPVPSTMLLLGSGLVGLAGLRKKFRK